jgi:hypothetical protein
VKKFQVFRRASIDEPFQLLKMYDFDDSEIKAEENETVFQGLVEVQSNPSTLYIDPDFKKDSKFIYAVVSIDAHGLTSNYSDQFEVTFDRFKNRVIKKRISASGAPKPYPNMYLSADTFGGEEKLKEALQLGKNYPFTVTLFEPKEQRMTLVFGEQKLEDLPKDEETKKAE